MSKRKENNPGFWEKLLKNEGMPADLPEEKHGKRVILGDGLGRKSDSEERDEDDGRSHSRMCPINLGHGLNKRVNQPNDRPVEEE